MTTEKKYKLWAVGISQVCGIKAPRPGWCPHQPVIRKIDFKS